MMVLRMLGTTVYAFDNLTPNGLMHVHRLGPRASKLSHNVYHTCMLRDLQILTQVFLNFTITQLAHSNITTFISQNNYQVLKLS